MTQPAFLPCACPCYGNHLALGSEIPFFLATDLKLGFGQALKGGGVSGENPKIRHFEFGPTVDRNLIPYSHSPVALHAPLFTTSSSCFVSVLVFICMNTTIFNAHVVQTRGFSIFTPPCASPHPRVAHVLLSPVLVCTTPTTAKQQK